MTFSFYSLIVFFSKSVERILKIFCSARAVLLATILLTVGFTSIASAEPEYDGQKDPYESLNRGVFGFNQWLDRWILKPVAKGYQWITPEPVDRAVSNFFDNLGDVPSMVNSGLQGDFNQMATTGGRIIINTTVGIAGFFDVASELDLERQPEDFGQTLAVWGVPAGPYVELPFLGGRNLRDAAGMFPDYFISPVSYVEDDATRNALTATNVVDIRADLIALESFIAGDRYSFLRDVYRQRREAAINNGVASESTGGGFDDDFGDEDF